MLGEQAVLQLLFDIKYLFCVLRLPERSDVSAPRARTRLDSLLRSVEAMGDPIELAVAVPLMDGRLAQLLQASSALFGCLLKLNPYSEVLTLSIAAAKTEVTKIFAVAPPISRVNGFPIKLYPSKKSKAAAAEAAAREEELKSSAQARAALAAKSAPAAAPPAQAHLTSAKQAASFFAGKLGLTY